MDNTSIISQIGNTPLVRLKQASELTDAIFMEKLNTLTLVNL